MSNLLKFLFGVKAGYKKAKGPLFISDKPYKIHKNKEAGESDLERLALEEEKEGAWLFSEDNQTWYNLRRGSWMDKDMLEGVMMASSSQLRLFGRYLTIYHTHTLPTIKKNFDMKLNDSRSPLSDALLYAKRTGDMRALYWFQSLAVSTEDVEADLTNLTNNPDCNLDFRIITPFGRVDMNYLLTPSNPQLFVIAYFMANQGVRSIFEDSYKCGKAGYHDIKNFVENLLNYLNSFSFAKIGLSDYLKINIIIKPNTTIKIAPLVRCP